MADEQNLQTAKQLVEQLGRQAALGAARAREIDRFRHRDYLGAAAWREVFEAIEALGAEKPRD